MCSAINTLEEKPGFGMFRKGNEPNGKFIPIDGFWVRCQCGQQIYFRSKNNVRWVAADPMPLMKVEEA